MPGLQVKQLLVIPLTFMISGNTHLITAKMQPGRIICNGLLLLAPGRRQV